MSKCFYVPMINIWNKIKQNYEDNNLIKVTHAMIKACNFNLKKLLY